MKYLVTVPIIGYNEYTVEVDDDMDFDDVRYGVLEGRIDLEPLSKKTQLEEYILVNSLDDFVDLPNDWPIHLEIKPY